MTATDLLSLQNFHLTGISMLSLQDLQQALPSLLVSLSILAVHDPSGRATAQDDAATGAVSRSAAA